MLQAFNDLKGTFSALSSSPWEPQSEETIVDKEHVKGAADKAKGAIKEAAGKMTGDKDMQAEGKFDKAKGAAHQAAGDIKDAMKR